VGVDRGRVLVPLPQQLRLRQRLAVERGVPRAGRGAAHHRHVHRQQLERERAERAHAADREGEQLVLGERGDQRAA
jgi:hypothetical protein